MKSIQILLVEDNEGDIVLTTEALEEAMIASKITVVKDGKEAILYLKDICVKANKELPDLILLDVNLPKMNGHEVLQKLKSSAVLRHIPVVMLTTSSAEKDILHSYKNFADFYITKPVEIIDLLNVVANIKVFK